MIERTKCPYDESLGVGWKYARHQWLNGYDLGWNGEPFPAMQDYPVTSGWRAGQSDREKENNQ